jgi:hypothetical protein
MSVQWASSYTHFSKRKLNCLKATGIQHKDIPNTSLRIWACFCCLEYKILLGIQITAWSIDIRGIPLVMIHLDFMFSIYCATITVADRVVQGMNCLRSLEHWDCGFESHSRHRCLCVRLFCVCGVLCVGSGLAMGWSHIQGVLPCVKKGCETEEEARTQQRDVEPLTNEWVYFEHQCGSSLTPGPYVTLPQVSSTVTFTGPILSVGLTAVKRQRTTLVIVQILWQHAVPWTRIIIPNHSFGYTEF